MSARYNEIYFLNARDRLFKCNLKHDAPTDVSIFLSVNFMKQMCFPIFLPEVRRLPILQKQCLLKELIFFAEKDENISKVTIGSTLKPENVIIN